MFEGKLLNSILLVCKKVNWKKNVNKILKLVILK